MKRNSSNLCTLCFSSDNVQCHHSVFKSQVRSLSHCKLNYTYLCARCHTELHRKKGGELDQKVKMIFQNKLEERFLKHYITYDEVKEVLNISNTATHKLLNGLVRYKEGYSREDLINACMGK